MKWDSTQWYNNKIWRCVYVFVSKSNSNTDCHVIEKGRIRPNQKSKIYWRATNDDNSNNNNNKYHDHLSEKTSSVNAVNITIVLFLSLSFCLYESIPKTYAHTHIPHVSCSSIHFYYQYFRLLPLSSLTPTLQSLKRRAFIFIIIIMH